MTQEDYKRLHPVPKERKGKTCANDCEKYPCFKGIDNMSSNFVEEGCRSFKPKK